MPSAAITRESSVLRASRLEFSYEDFAGEWRGKERDRLIAMTDALLPDTVLAIWTIRTREQTMAEIWAEEEAKRGLF